ncbi:hypothetical protein BS78_05G283600 [Paspalum vaginatum]|nr:hypothetical protein BS78_05G283600 [Paspalum vaginatum]KAJ1277288.1 hypothetical protein BS78_05G283600 [Paspalum vaginatum]
MLVELRWHPRAAAWAPPLPRFAGSLCVTARHECMTRSKHGKSRPSTTTNNECGGFGPWNPSGDTHVSCWSVGPWDLESHHTGAPFHVIQFKD